MGFFSDLFGTSGAATDAANAKAQGYLQGQGAVAPLWTQARGDITTGYQGAQDTLSPLNALGTAGAGAYADITGAAGAAGQDRARALFQTDPGYQFARDEALKATQRASGTGGYQGSGNVLTALQDRASGLAQQQYGNYVNRLAPFLGYSLGAGGALAGAQAGQGTQLANLGTKQIDQLYGTYAGVGGAQAGGILGEANAEQQALGNAINLGGKLLGYATGGGGLGSIGGAGSTSFLGGAGPIFGGTNPNAWYTG